MIELGYTLSSEEFPPNDLIRHAQRAEALGFTFAGISDHFHPWLDQQGNSPFAWTTLGGVAATTRTLKLITGVTCPLIRYHPAIIAQAAATVASMIPGRFSLGLGTGENLNEHIIGTRWPPVQVRQEMLQEAVDIIRQLWQGGDQSHRGVYYTVDNARIYTLPPEPPPIVIAAAGTDSATMAGKIGDGLISVAPQKQVVQTFEQAGGDGKPKYAQMTVCWAKDEETARQTAFKWWANSGVTGQLSQELALPQYFEQATKMLDPKEATKSMSLGPDPERYLKDIQTYADAGFTHIYIHQVGPDQEGFFTFAAKEVLPKVGQVSTASAASRS